MAIRVGLGLSTEKDTLQAAVDAARSAKINLSGAKTDLALVFSSTEFSHPTVLKTIRAIIGDVNIIGCSCAGLITNNGVFKRGIMVALLSLPADVQLNLAYINNISNKLAVSAGRELGEKLYYGFRNIPRDLGVMFFDGLIKNGTGILNGLHEKFGRSFPIIGASASDNLEFKKTYQYFNTEVFSDGSCGLLWGGKINFGLGIQHGWKPIGKPRYVTRSSANIVYEINAAPAANIYKEYFASEIDKLNKELKRISIFYPIGIYLAGEEEYLLRNLLSIEDNGALVFQGDVPQNSQIRLMIGTKESCLSATSQAADDCLKGLAGRHCNFIFVFDSVSRYILLGRQAERELEILKEKFGKSTPIIGIYTFGEQAPLESILYHGMSYFHNQTIAVLGIEG